MSVKPVQEVIRSGLEELLRAALEKEIEEFIRTHRDDIGPDGLKQIVRNGYHKEREIQCAVGTVRVAVPRSRDRSRKGGDKIIFQSRIIPRYMRRVNELDALIPSLYLKGLLSGDFSGLFSFLLGEPGERLLPVSDVEEMKTQWDTGERPGWGYWNISNPNNDDWGYWNSGSPGWRGSSSSVWWGSNLGGWFNRWESFGSGGYPANDYHAPWGLQGLPSPGKWETKTKREQPVRQRHQLPIIAIQIENNRIETTVNHVPACRVGKRSRSIGNSFGPGQKVEAKNQSKKMEF
ncbi:MAG: hypothetical protein GY940_47670 [bacterium]|nr:hypothetical protein [bacterium]